MNDRTEESKARSSTLYVFEYSSQSSIPDVERHGGVV
jgi:hypothetical protein